MSDGERSERTRWVWVAACTFSGVAVLTVAVEGESWWRWQGVWPGILVNLGTTLLLVAILFFLEQRFTGRVVRASERAVQKVTVEVEEHLQRRTDELSARIDDLQSQISRRMEARAQTQDRAVADLETPTYTTVTEALTAANRSGALSGGVVTVQPSSDPAGIGLIFRWGTHTDQGGNQPGLRLEVEARPRLRTTRRLPLSRMIAKLEC